MSDPSSRRATRLARLVILTVALPSLLLTALGVVAVANEEAAARKRLETLYTPLGRQLSERFNAWMQLRLQTEPTPLRALAEWAGLEWAGGEPMSDELEAFLAHATHATNYFVIDAALGQLVPAPDEPLDAAAERAIIDAVGFETPSTCDPARRYLTSSSSSSPEYCPVALSAALCSQDGKTWRSFDRHCRAWSKHPAVGSIRGLLDSGGLLNRTAFMRVADAIAFQLSRPEPDAPPRLAPIVASRTASLLTEDALDTIRLRQVLQSIATRTSLISTLASRSRLLLPRETASEAVAVGEWRRVIISRSVGGRLVGYELLAPRVAEILTAQNSEEGLAQTIDLHFLPTSAPDWWWGEHFDKQKKTLDRDIVWWALLKRTDIAWSIALDLCGDQGFWSLSRSRSGLYLWALILIAIALVGGIAFTLRAVAHEGRLSRLKTDFVSSVSHDLRTPLTSIRMFTESLLMGRVSDEQQKRQYLEVIAEEAERLSRLTERILDFSRMEAGRKAYAYQDEEVGPLIEKTLRSCRPMIEESEGKVTVEVASGLPPIRGDRDALVEMLINLVTNALKYSEDEPDIAIRARRAGPHVVIEVEDHGIGIGVSDQRRIFEKFHRVDCRRTSEVGGSGIGLSLVQHIVESHGGSVSVSSTLGRGSTFSIRLPITGPSGALASADSTPTVESDNMAP